MQLHKLLSTRRRVAQVSVCGTAKPKSVFEQWSGHGLERVVPDDQPTPREASTRSQATGLSTWFLTTSLQRLKVNDHDLKIVA